VCSSDLNPDADIFVVEPGGWDDMRQSLECGTIVPLGDNPPDTDCDALQTLRVAPITFNIMQTRNGKGNAVTEKEVHHAMRVAFESLHLVVEPGGAVALAAALAGKIKLTERTAITISGGNVDRKLFSKILNDN